MRKTLACCAAAVMAIGISAVPVGAAEWTGKISDAMCGVKHANGEHGTKKMTDRACVEACVKGGEKYVFVAGDKVYKIGNQDFADLKAHAGHEVVLTGDMKGDTVTVSKIVMPAKK